MLLVASDRVSAFDVVMGEGIPDKGKVLTQLSAFWFERLGDLVPNHMVSVSSKDLEAIVGEDLPQVAGRGMIARKTDPVLIECVARGYLAGSWYKDYASGTREIHGLRLPENLRNGSQLPEPIFTPATKNDAGHDENISFEAAADQIGFELASKLREWTMNIYAEASKHCESVGLILADTKFEFGLTEDGPIWIDEALTPDSSRYWTADYVPGDSPPSFDKQFLRDFLESSGWDKTYPAPELPQAVIQGTRERYLDAYRRITGHDLDL